MPLEVFRVYKMVGFNMFTIVKFIGKRLVIYDNYNSMDTLLIESPSEETMSINEFKEKYLATKFIYDSGEV